MCLYNLFYSIQLSLPTMPNNSLALTCCSSQLQNLVSLGCHQTKSQSSIIAQQSDSFGCNKWRYSTQPFGYTTIYIHIYLYIHTYIYMKHSQFAEFFFVNASRIQTVIYTLEGDFSVAR